MGILVHFHTCHVIIDKRFLFSLIITIYEIISKLSFNLEILFEHYIPYSNSPCFLDLSVYLLTPPVNYSQNEIHMFPNPSVMILLHFFF